MLVANLVFYSLIRTFAVDMGKIIVAGIGPGSKEDITPAVLEAVREADAIVGYKYYFQFIEAYVKEGCECIDTGMKKERERAERTGKDRCGDFLWRCRVIRYGATHLRNETGKGI